MKGPARWKRTAQIKNGQGLGDILGSVLGNSLRGSMEVTTMNKARKGRKLFGAKNSNLLLESHTKINDKNTAGNIKKIPSTCM